MGYEIGQFAEWSESRELDWFLLDYERHSQLKEFIKELNRLYASYPEIYATDGEPQGFEWLIVDDNKNDVFVFERKDGSGRSLIFVLNFSNLTYFGYCVGIGDGKLSLLLDSDEIRFGGKGTGKDTEITENPFKGKNRTLSMTVPALSGRVYMLDDCEEMTVGLDDCGEGAE